MKNGRQLKRTKIIPTPLDENNIQIVMLKLICAMNFSVPRSRMITTFCLILQNRTTSDTTPLDKIIFTPYSVY